jgi:hypothetical protein
MNVPANRCRRLDRPWRQSYHKLAKHDINGKVIARLGDKVECPQYYPGGKPHGINKIITAHETVTVGHRGRGSRQYDGCGCKFGRSRADVG